MKNGLKSLKLILLICAEIIRRNKKYFLLGVAAIVLLAFIQIKFNLFYTGNSIRIGLIGTFQEHDLPSDVTRLISSGLIIMDEVNMVKPNLVSGWETNNDATQFKFKLKDNLKWSNKEKIISRDLEFNIPDVEVTYPDEKEIQFKLKDSYSPFPTLLTRPVFKKGTLLGLGPYRISKIEKSRIFITKITLNSDDPKLPVILVRFYPTEKVALTGFSLGEVEALLGVNNVKYFSNNPTAAIRQKTDYTKIVTVLLSVKDSLLSNRSLRQALSFISPKIDNEEIADNPYPPFSWAYDRTAKKYLNSPEEANSALERAKSNLPDDKLNAEIILTSTPNLEEVGNQVVNNWKSLGFDAKLRVESGIPQNFQALLITQSIPLDPDQYFLWHATQNKTNLSGLDSKRVDKDLEDGRKITTEQDRRIKYYDFQKALLEEAPAIFLYFPKYNIVYLKKSEKLLDKILSF